MPSKWQSRSLVFRTILRGAAAVALGALAISTVLALMVVKPPVITSRCGTDH